MSVPSVQDLFQPTMDALHILGGSATNAGIESHVLERLKLTEEDALQTHGQTGLTELQYRLLWARTYLKKAGLLTNPTRGAWVLTEQGKAQPTLDAAAVYHSVRESLHQTDEAETEDAGAGKAERQSRAQKFPPATTEEQTVAGESDLTSLTPHLPTYTSARHFLRILDGTAYGIYRGMVDAIWSQRGTPQETTEWVDPETWIPERLDGEPRALALRLWRESKGEVNPRHVRGAWYLAIKHTLLERGGDDVLRITDRGQDFIGEPAGQVAAEIDRQEGILAALKLVAEKGPGWRGEFLPDFSDFCRTYTTARSEQVIKTYLYDRLQNMVERSFIVRRGLSYAVTDQGLAYLDAHIHLLPGYAPGSRRQSDLRRLAQALRQEARQQLAEYLSSMNPFKFEELIKLLLEEMGYQDVTTTAPVNDKGVDVVANIELGISSVREVIQVKRHKGSLNRTVLDQLRGSLHRFNAVRGTVISTGRFSKGAQEAAFERGAAPITLIDGDKLLDLLMERQIGVSRRSVEYYEFDSAKLVQFEGNEIVSREA